MPVNKKEMKAMMDEYGKKKGKSVYYAMEMKKEKMPKMPKKKMMMGGKSPKSVDLGHTKRRG